MFDSNAFLISLNELRSMNFAVFRASNERQIFDVVVIRMHVDVMNMIIFIVGNIAVVERPHRTLN